MKTNFIKEQFNKDNFVHTNWAEIGKKFDKAQENKCNKFLEDIIKCANCDRLVVDCQLEDKIRGFGDDDNSLDKYMPLNTCIKCLETTNAFLLCTECTETKKECKRKHPVRDYKPIQPQLFNLIKQVKYKCHFCAPNKKDKKADLEMNETEKFYSPMGLRNHMLNDCKECLKTV